MTGPLPALYSRATRKLFLVPAAVAILHLAGCAPSSTGHVRTESRPGGQVTEAEWADFLAQVVTPRFPDGLTVFDARGQWRSSKGDVEKESTKVIVVIRSPGEKGSRAIDEIRAEYKRRFRQESVLRVDAPVAAGF